MNIDPKKDRANAEALHLHAPFAADFVVATMAIEPLPFAAVHDSLPGTNRTCLGSPPMSVDRGRPEDTGRRVKTALLTRSGLEQASCRWHPSVMQIGAARMAVEQFDIDAWFSRIGYDGSREPTRGNLRRLVTAHATAIAYESIDVLLNKPPSLDPKLLQSKMIFGGRGGYCFEQNMLFRAGLRSLGYKVTSLQVRVVRGLEVDAPLPMLHMVLRIDLPEGPFLADVGFGNLAPTTALKLLVDEEQETPHEIMRFVAMGDELVLQSKLGYNWEHIYRVVFLPRVDAEYAICNWFTATHPKSPHLNNLIAARPGPNRTRLTLFNSRLSVRYPSGEVDRRTISGSQGFRDVLTKDFGIRLSDFDLETAVTNMEQRGTSGAPHPSFA